MNFLSLALLSIGAFVSTNIDDLFLLVGFFSDRSYSRVHIFGGQILGMAIIVFFDPNTAPPTGPFG